MVAFPTSQLSQQQNTCPPSPDFICRPWIRRVEVPRPYLGSTSSARQPGIDLPRIEHRPTYGAGGSSDDDGAPLV